MRISGYWTLNGMWVSNQGSWYEHNPVGYAPAEPIDWITALPSPKAVKHEGLVLIVNVIKGNA